MKVKQTLSIDEEILKEAKHKAIDMNTNLSDLTEQALKEYLRKED